MTIYWRALNAAFWFYMWLSQALMPVDAPSADFWAAKAGQLLQFGPFDDLGPLIGRGIVPIALWAVIDWRLRQRAARRKAAGS